MQRLGPRADLVLEKIFKGFYHIWAWQPFWSLGHAHFSNLSFSCPKEVEQHWPRSFRGQVIWNYQHFFPYGAHTNAYRSKLDLAVKRSNVNVQPSFQQLGRPPVPDDLCKDSATRHPWSWRSRFLKVFTIYGHGSHLGQWTATILAIFHSPAPGRFKIKFAQHCPRGSRGEVVWNSQHFSHTHANLTSP